MCMKVPAIVEEIKKALSQDTCVVIGLQTTGEVQELYVIIIYMRAYTLGSALSYWVILQCLPPTFMCSFIHF